MGKSLENRVLELEKEVKILKKEKAIKVIKKQLGIGDIFELAGVEWKILDITKDGYKCLAENLSNKKMFDKDTNDWKSSSLRKYLNNEFYQKLVDEIGEENIVTFERNLLSKDGQTEYGICNDKVSLLNIDEYRKYRNLIPNTDNYWWWTITPDSTPCNNDSQWVTVVSPSGNVYYSSCYDGSGEGVRPFCIFSSLIFESEE